MSSHSPSPSTAAAPSTSYSRPFDTPPSSYDRPATYDRRMVSADTLVKTLIVVALSAAVSLSAWTASSVVTLREENAKTRTAQEFDRAAVAQLRDEIREMVADQRQQNLLLQRIAAQVDRLAAGEPATAAGK